MPKRRKKIEHPVIRAAKVIHRHAKDHFIPHPGNNHLPHVLKHRALFGFSLALVLLKAFALIATVLLPSTSVLSSAITGQNVVSLTNQTRSGLSLVELRTSPKLTQAAQAKADDMLLKQYFAHNSPEGATPWTFIRAAGYAYSVAGENLAVHYTEAEDVQTGWMTSPTHRANIVNPKFREIGIGIARGLFEGHESIIVVQMFGTPKAELVQTAPSVPTTTKAAVPVVAAAYTQKPSTNKLTIEPEATKPAIPAVKTVAIDQASLKVVPHDDLYDVQVSVQNATSVIAQLGTEWTELTPIGKGEWSGSLRLDPTASEQVGISILARGLDGRDALSTVAMITPSAQAQDVYAFGAPANASYKLFGLINLNGLGDGVRQIYLVTLIFLASSLLLSFLVKFKLHHPSMAVHALAVMGLSALLWRL